MQYDDDHTKKRIEDKTMTIFYFTATGNSLYAARKIGGTLVSIPQAIKAGKYEFCDDEIGVVCPVYANKLPSIVADFLNKATLKAKYKFLILTYGHANFGADGYALKTFEKQHFDYVKTLLTVDNYLPAFDMAKEKSLDKQTEKNLDAICLDIAQHAVYKPKMSVKNRIANSIVQKYFAKRKSDLDGSQILITDKCVGCGLCAKVCPMGNIYVENGVAKRKSNECEFCLACANLCPRKAIVCKNSDVNPNERYINPNVSVSDIVDSNEQ